MGWLREGLIRQGRILNATGMDTFDTVSTDERKILDLRRHGITDMPVLGHYCYRKAAGGLGREMHSEHFEITYLAKGVQIYETEGVRTVLQGGDLYITRPGEFHSTAGQPEEKGEAYWIFLRKTVSSSVFRFSASASARLMEIYSRGERVCRATEGVQRHLDVIFALAGKEMEPLDLALLECHVELLVLEIAGCMTSVKKAEVGDAIGKVLDFLRADGGWELSIGDLAERADLSEARFKVRFKDEVGIPPGEYLMRRRIEKAKFLLRRGSSRISEIAKQLMFPTSQYFATVFKRYTGKTPQDWRDEKRS
jgi:AraC-like DNA-binding protein